MPRINGRMPAGMLKNTATNRFHPIIFRLAPMPGNSDADSAAQRYKSAGHHTAGFDTEEAAIANITGNDKLLWSGVTWTWDGTGVPAMVEWFGDTPDEETKAA